jgi:hypothetical protein
MGEEVYGRRGTCKREETMGEVLARERKLGYSYS